MPLYEFQCPRCEKYRSDVRTVEARHDGPRCDHCGAKMTLLMSPVRGIVKDPAVPRSSR